MSVKAPSSVPAMVVGHARIAAFVCPSDLGFQTSSAIDPATGWETADMGWNNYGCSEGSNVGWDIGAGDQNGFFKRQNDTKFGDIIDGLSNTIMMGEFTKGDNTSSIFTVVGGDFPNGSRSQADSQRSLRLKRPSRLTVKAACRRHLQSPQYGWLSLERTGLLQHLDQHACAT